MKTKFLLFQFVTFLLTDNWQEVIGININVDNVLKLKLPQAFSSINKDAAYFGYSLSFSEQERQTWLYVGAPRADTIEQKKLNISKPGAVFKCLVYDFYSSNNDRLAEPCSHVPINLPNISLDNNMQIIQDDEWLGANIYTTSRNSQQMLLACSYRGRIKIPSRTYYYAKGLCYGVESTNDVELIYLSGHNSAYFPGSNVSVFNEGFAQFGTSIGISMESGYIAIGAPGLWNWRGGIVVRISENTCNLQNLDIPEDSYLGYSVIWIDLKYDNNDGFQTLAAGAPRANIFGKVFIFSIYQNCSYNVLQVLDGKQFGSYFGATLLAVALNSDKLGDLLLVGSPIYNQSNGDEGAVFIYLNKNNKELEFVGILKGSEKRGARFGSAMELLGDINLDNFNDVVISSPFEDRGVIYIYLGTSDGLQPKFSQIITAKQIFGNQMQNIGISMKYHINSNGYPVLAIGSHRNDTVVVLGIQPIHSLEILMKFDSEKIEWSHGQCGSRGEQLVKLNLSIIFTYIVPKKELNYGTPYNFLSNITYWLEMDVSIKKKRGYIESRVDKSWMEKVSENLSFVESNFRKPLTRMWTLVFPITKQPNNISMPIDFIVNISQNLNKNIQQKIVKSLNDFVFLEPVLNTLKENNFSSSIFFHKECGLDDICSPKFILSYNQSMPIAIINSLAPIVIPCYVSNNGESAYSVQVRITHPLLISFDSVLVSRDSCNRLLCIPESLKNVQDPSTNTVINCDLENTIRTENILSFDLYFTWNKQFDWSMTPESIGLKVMVRNNETSVEEAIKIKTRYMAQVVEISKTQEEFPIPTDDILMINQRMEVRNIGPGIMPKFVINIFHLAFFNQHNTTSISATLKKRVESVKGTEKVQILEQDLALEVVPTDGNQINLPYLEDFIRQQQYDPIKHLILNCMNIKCVNLRTIVDGFDVEDSIEIAINLNVDENFLLILKHFAAATFENEGHVTPAIFNVANSNWSADCCTALALNCCNDTLMLQARSTVKNEGKVKVGPATWVIILGIIMGILCMCLLIFMLWKCGFFRRSKHEKLIAEKKRSRIISTYDDSVLQKENDGIYKKTDNSVEQQMQISNAGVPNNLANKSNEALGAIPSIIETERTLIEPEICNEDLLNESNGERIKTEPVNDIFKDITKDTTSVAKRESKLAIDKDGNKVESKNLEVHLKNDTNINVAVNLNNEAKKLESKL